MRWVLSHRPFMWVLLAQFVSLIGSSVMDFGAAVWVFKQTQSISAYAWGIAFAVLPGVAATPLFMRLIGRVDRIRLMAAANGIGILSSLALLAVMALGPLQAHHVYIAGAVCSVCRSLERVAYLSALSQLLPEARWGNAGGLANLTWGLAQVVVPPLSVVLLTHMGIEGLVWIDLVSFATAALLLVALGIKAAPARAPAASPADRPVTLRGTLAYLLGRPVLGPMMGYFFVFNLLMGMVISSLAPLILSLHSEALLSQVLMFAGVGALAGGLLVSWRGVPRQLAKGIFLPVAGIGLVILVGGILERPWVLCTCTFLVMLSFPLVTSSDQVFWQANTSQRMQGPVFAMREMLATSALPLSALLGGVLYEALHGLLDPGGASRALGKGEGLRILFMLAGGALWVFGMIPLALKPVPPRGP